MIYCPKCGTANRDGSKFCNECGEKLGSQTQVKCPQCGALNSVQSVFCSECGGRLLPSATSGSGTGVPPAIKGLSLPTKASIGEGAEEPAAGDVPEADEEVPAWLQELGAALSTGEAGGPASVEDSAEIPDWLQDLRASLPEEPVSQVPQVEEAEEGQVADWMAELRPSVEEAEPEPQPPVAEEVEEGEVPDWLAELQPPALEETAAAVPPSAEETTQVPGMPGWLEELRAEAPEAPSPAEGTAAEAELPDWLVPSGPELGKEEESLTRAEIPDWLLALKPQELREEGEVRGAELVVEEAAEETGLLAGLQGTLPVEMLIAQPRAVIAAEVETPIADTPQARLFAEIVGEPPEAAPKAIPQPSKGLLALLPRWIIYITLIAAVTLPLLLDKSPLSRTLEPSPAVAGLYDRIESLDSGSPVLVAFDYDPTTSGEMDLLTRAIVGHLMDREARVVAVSLLPAGPATAQSVLDELASERPGYADGYGQRYTNLGYIPGQAAAVRLLGQSVRMALSRDFQNNPLANLQVMEGLTTAQSFDLIVELAAAQDTLRWWIEQAGTPYGVPLGAGVSASVGPLARPYSETERQQLVGLVSGVPDAAVYEALRSGQDSPAGTMAARLDSQLAGHVVLLMVLLVGNGVYLVRRRNGRAG